jgi:hypothetical protein
MPVQESPPNNPTTAARPTYEELVRQVARRVWELWQQDLRREQERRGQIGKK